MTLIHIKHKLSVYLIKRLFLTHTIWIRNQVELRCLLVSTKRYGMLHTTKTGYFYLKRSQKHSQQIVKHYWNQALWIKTITPGSISTNGITSFKSITESSKSLLFKFVWGTLGEHRTRQDHLYIPEMSSLSLRVFYRDTWIIYRKYLSHVKTLM